MNKAAFIREWKHCRRCPLHLTARHHVVHRGSIPAEVLLIGEAPGKTEDTLGKPFIGRSGQLLTTAIQKLGINSYCITNIVCCIPLTAEGAIRQPSKEEAASCSPHLEELIELCSPKLIVLLGNEPKKYFRLDIMPTNTNLVMLRHPAYILRKGGVNSLEFKRFLEAFTTALSNSDVLFASPFKTIGA